MEWYIVLLLVFGGLLVLMLTGIPIAMAFLIVNLFGAFFLFGGLGGIEQLILSIYSNLASFSLLPLPLFILMGDVLYHSGIGPLLIDVLDRWLGRLPGRLAVMSVLGGTVLSVLTGASVGSVAMLGNTLVPEMDKRGYARSMSLGPIIGSGGLAIMIPPSGLAVLLGAVGEISIGKILIAIIVPGLVLAALYGLYIIGRCFLQPSLAPAYDVPPQPLWEKIKITLKYIVPLLAIIFMVTGVIILGIATPTEAAATGAFGVFLMTALYKRLTWKVTVTSVGSTLKVMGMIFLIICGAVAFSSLLSFSAVTSGVGNLLTSKNPIITVIITQIIVFVLGCFMEPASIMMITLPIFLPVIKALHLDTVWFAVIFLLNIEMSLLTPPFGLNLFVMKGVAPPDTTMHQIYMAGIPFLLCDAILMVLLLVFPDIALWLPSVMH